MPLTARIPRVWSRAPCRGRAPIAQLDRALVYGTRCRKFESSWARRSGFIWSRRVKMDARCTTWMRVALEEADAAAAEGEVPVGCVVVDADGASSAAATTRGRRWRIPRRTPRWSRSARRPRVRGAGGSRERRCTSRWSRARCARARSCTRGSRAWSTGARTRRRGAVTTLFGDRERRAAEPPLRGRARACSESECAERLRRFFAELRAQAGRAHGRTSEGPSSGGAVMIVAPRSMRARSLARRAGRGGGRCPRARRRRSRV